MTTRVRLSTLDLPSLVGTAPNLNIGGTAANSSTQAEKVATVAIATTAYVDRLRSLSTPSTGSSGTLVVGDRGSKVNATGTITVPASVFVDRDVVTIFNNSGAAITIVQGGGFTLRNAGTTSVGNRSLAAYGLATVVFNGVATAVISGAGLT